MAGRLVIETDVKQLITMRWGKSTEEACCIGDRGGRGGSADLSWPRRPGRKGIPGREDSRAFKDMETLNSR